MRVNKWGYLKNMKGSVGVRTKVKKDTVKKSITPEKIIQKQAEELLDIKSEFYIRIPDSLLCFIMNTPTVPMYIKKIVSNFFAGLPDLIIFKRTENATICFPLEIKTENGKLSQAQKKVQSRIGTIVSYGFNDTMKKIQNFINEN